VIPPSHRKAESPILFTEKTVLKKEKGSISISVSIPAAVFSYNVSAILSIYSSVPMFSTAE
jgi:hypothetical protein